MSSFHAYIIYSVHYQRDGNRNARVTTKAPNTTPSSTSKSYQHHTKSTVQRSSNVNTQQSGQMKVGDPHYKTITRTVPILDEGQELYEDMSP